MSNLLIIHSGLEGITNACLEVGKRLEENGHKIYSTSIHNQRKKIEANSLYFVEVSPIKLNFNENRSWASWIKRTLFDKAKMYDEYYNALQYPKFNDILEAKKIDGLIIDMELHEYILYADVNRIPFILLNQWFSIWKSPNNLPLPLSLSLKPRSRWMNTLIWKYSYVTGIAKTYGNNIKTLGFNRRSFILYLAKRLNYNSSNFHSYMFPLPFYYTNNPTISITHPDLESDNNSISFLTYGYPMVYDKRKEVITQEFATDIKNILEKIQDSNKTLIVATNTTMKKNQKQSLSNLLKALSQLDNAISIVSLGSQYSPKLRKQYLSKGIYLYQSIPQIEALKFADICIHHGGIHTINECIHYQVPMIILSGGKYDQNGCAARIAKYECGIVSFKKVNSVKNIKKYLDRILTDPIYRDKITELCDSYTKAQEEKVLEKYVTEFFLKEAN